MPAKIHQAFIEYSTSERSPYTLMLLFVLATAVLLAGCASFDSHSTLAKVGVTAATMKVIEAGGPEQYQTRAAEVKETAAKAYSFFDAGTATVDVLGGELMQRVDALNLPPSDAMLAKLLVAAVVEEMQARTQSGAVPPEQLYRVAQVLDWVIDTAELYLP